MDKIEKFHIAKVPYHIEPKAETELKKYLSDIKSNLDADTADDVLQDIESRIPELLAVRHVKLGGVITYKDVVAIKEQLGDPEQFSSDQTVQKNGGNPKKLFRDTDSSIIGGVASGLGNYFNIDSNIVRVIFFVLIFFSGFGIILYLFLWLLLPEAKTGADKLLMSGKPVTVATLQKYRLSVQNSLGRGPRLIQRLIYNVFRVVSVLITALLSLMLLSGFGLLSGLFYMYPFRPIVSVYSPDYLLLGLMWLACISLIGLLIMLTFRIWGAKSSRLNISAISLSVMLIFALAGSVTTGLIVFNHFSSKYGNDKDIRSLSLVNSTPSVVPSSLNVNSDSNLNLTYVISSQPLHATYESYPGMNHPNLTISNDKGVISVNSTQLDQVAPSCLGDLCKQIYLPVHVFIYGPNLTQFSDYNGATLNINNNNFGKTVTFNASNSSIINVNNSYSNSMYISATNGASVSANNTSAQNTSISIDSNPGSNVTSPITNTLTANMPLACDEGDLPGPIIFLSGFSQKTVINGQVQNLNDLSQNDCLNNGN
jgi:phage shock protein PspC (stress-responsive transcriptional regulator)